jgi:hypothetical protein
MNDMFGINRRRLFNPFRVEGTVTRLLPRVLPWAELFERLRRKHAGKNVGLVERKRTFRFPRNARMVVDTESHFPNASPPRKLSRT